MNKILLIKLFFLISFLTYSEEKIDGKHLFSFKCDTPENHTFNPSLTENFVIFNSIIYEDLNPEVDKNIYALEKAEAKITVFWKDRRVRSRQLRSLYYGINEFQLVQEFNKKVPGEIRGDFYYKRSYSPLNIKEIQINRTTLDAKWILYESDMVVSKDPFPLVNYTTKCEIVDSGYAQKWEKFVNGFIDKEKERKMKEETKKVLEERKI